MGMGKVTICSRSISDHDHKQSIAQTTRRRGQRSEGYPPPEMVYSVTSSARASGLAGSASWRRKD